MSFFQIVHVQDPLERKAISLKIPCLKDHGHWHQVKGKACCILEGKYWEMHISEGILIGREFYKTAPLTQISYSFNLNPMASVLKRWMLSMAMFFVVGGIFEMLTLVSPQLCGTTGWEEVGTSLVRCTRETELANFRYTQCFRYSCGF